MICPSDPVTAPPLVSVKMLAYNHEPYIRRAIEGILQQKTLFPFELVIGEDCSTDNTRGIVFEYQRKHPEIIRVLAPEKNLGAKENSRQCDLACRGKYLAYCEGDDYWHAPDKLQRQVAFLEAHPDYVLVHSDYRTFEVKSGRMSRRSVGLSEGLDDANAFDEILSGRRLILTLTVCLRKPVLDSVQRECPECYDPRFLMGDTQRWLEVSRRGKVRYFPEVLATHQILPESATQSKDPARVLRFALSAKDVLDHYIAKYGASPETKVQARMRSAINLLRCAWAAGDVRVADEALNEYRQVGRRIPWEAQLYYHGSRSPLAKQIVRPALATLTFSKRGWRKLGRMVRS